MSRNTIILVVILIALAAIGFWTYRSYNTQAPTTGAPTYVGPTSDAPAAIDKDLSNIDTGANLEADISSNTKDITNL